MLIKSTMTSFFTIKKQIDNVHIEEQSTPSLVKGSVISEHLQHLVTTYCLLP